MLQRWTRGVATDRDLAGDVQFLVDRLGAFPASDWSIVFAAFDPAGLVTPTGAVGGTSQGLSVVADFGLGSPQAWRTTVVHELAHAWIGVDVIGDDGATWIQEALPTLLETMRHPSIGRAPGLFVDAVDDTVSALDIEEYNLERRVAPEDDRRYVVGSHALAQAHSGARALGLTDTDVWAAWSGFLATQPSGLEGSADPADVCGDPPGPTDYDVVPPDGRPMITHDALAEMFTLDLGLPSFHCEWVHLERVGVPLLGIESFDPAGEVVVRQFQPELLDWPLFSHVPFHLACAPEGSSRVAAFDECTQTADGPRLDPWAVGTPAVAEADRHLLLHGAVANPMPATVALLAVEHLPETEGIGLHDGSDRAATLLLRCDGVYPACVPDDDGDGFPAQGDCDDADPLVHPDAPVGAWLAAGSESVLDRDLNCDGWPTASFYP